MFSEPKESIISESVRIAAAHYPSADWESLSVEIRRAEDYIGEDVLAITQWDDHGDCFIVLMDTIQTETDMRETLAHELAHFIMGDLFTEWHNKRPHGSEWFSIYCNLQRKLVWELYFPEDWA